MSKLPRFKLADESQNSYDFACFKNLAYEFDLSDKKDTERKIKRALKFYNLGEYDQERVDYIRSLRNEIYSEISLESISKYYNKTNSTYTDLEDFDLMKMLSDYSNKFVRITKNDLTRILNFSIYLYYMR